MWKLVVIFVLCASCTVQVSSAPENVSTVDQAAPTDDAGITPAPEASPTTVDAGAAPVPEPAPAAVDAAPTPEAAAPMVDAGTTEPEVASAPAVDSGAVTPAVNPACTSYHSNFCTLHTAYVHLYACSTTSVTPYDGCVVAAGVGALPVGEAVFYCCP